MYEPSRVHLVSRGKEKRPAHVAPLLTCWTLCSRVFCYDYRRFPEKRREISPEPVPWTENREPPRRQMQQTFFCGIESGVKNVQPATFST